MLFLSYFSIRGYFFHTLVPCFYTLWKLLFRKMFISICPSWANIAASSLNMHSLSDFNLYPHIQVPKWKANIVSENHTRIKIIFSNYIFSIPTYSLECIASYWRVIWLIIGLASLAYLLTLAWTCWISSKKNYFYGMYSPYYFYF